MNDKQKGFFNNNNKQQKQDVSNNNNVPVAQEKRALININLDGKGLLVIGFIVWMLLESFAPDHIKPSIYFARRASNFENEKIEKTQEKIAKAEALKAKEIGLEQIEVERQKAFEVGNVNNALEEEKADAIQKLTKQIELATNCEAQKLQIANQAISECMNNEKSTPMDCEIVQASIEDQPCPSLPKMSERNKKLLADYRKQGGIL